MQSEWKQLTERVDEPAIDDEIPISNNRRNNLQHPHFQLSNTVIFTQKNAFLLFKLI